MYAVVFVLIISYHSRDKDLRKHTETSVINETNQTANSDFYKWNYSKLRQKVFYTQIERWIRCGMIWHRTIFCCEKPSWLFSWPWFSGCRSKPAEYLRSELLYVDFVTRFDLRAFQSFTCVLCFHEIPEEYWATSSIISRWAVVLICHDLQDLVTCGSAVLDLPFHSYFEVHWPKPLLLQRLWSLKEKVLL